MSRPIVAVEASAVGSFRRKSARLLDVTGGAFFFENCVRPRHAAAAVDAVVAGKSAPRNPDERAKRQQETEPEFGALQRRRPLEIVQVDALRELFCSACACHVFALVAQRHDGVNGAEQNESERKRNVQEQPAVQPAV